MRPDPRDISTLLKARTTLKPWKSMPAIPTPASKSDSKATTPRAGRRSRRTRRFSERRASLPSGRRTSIASSLRSSLHLPDVERNERFDRESVTSVQIDGFKMLYKTDDRVETILDKTSKLWNFEPKKANKNWFLGNIHHTKAETPPNEIIIPRKMKPYTSYIRTIQRQFVRKPTTVVECIAEEEETK